MQLTTTMTRTLTELSSKTEISTSKGAEIAQGQLGEREDNFDFHNCNNTTNQELHYKSI